VSDEGLGHGQHRRLMLSYEHDRTVHQPLQIGFDVVGKARVDTHQCAGIIDAAPMQQPVAQPIAGMQGRELACGDREIAHRSGAGAGTQHNVGRPTGETDHDIVLNYGAGRDEAGMLHAGHPTTGA
jgi:hypothetical protein